MKIVGIGGIILGILQTLYEDWKSGLPLDLYHPFGSKVKKILRLGRGPAPGCGPEYAYLNIQPGSSGNIHSQWVIESINAHFIKVAQYTPFCGTQHSPCVRLA